MIAIGNAIGISFGGSGGVDWASYWKSQPEVLFFGLYSEISGGQMPNKVTGATDYLTVAGVAGSETYQAPNTAAYIAADTDYIWFKTDETQRTPTEAELVGYDFPRTPVKYDDDDPYSIRWIAIIKTGVTLTADQLNDLHESFYLHTLWSGVINGYGHIKGNKMAQTLWTPEAVATYIDTFTDTDGVELASHTPDSANFTWINVTYLLKISGNTALAQSSGAFAHAYFDCNNADVDISADFEIPDGNNYMGALLIRRAGNSTHWRVSILRSAGATPIIRIQKYTTLIHSVEITHAAGWGTLRCVASGNDFTVYWKGVKVIDRYTTDGSWNTEQHHGLLGYFDATFPQIKIDNFKIL